MKVIESEDGIWQVVIQEVYEGAAGEEHINFEGSISDCYAFIKLTEEGIYND